MFWALPSPGFSGPLPVAPAAVLFFWSDLVIGKSGRLATRLVAFAEFPLGGGKLLARCPLSMYFFTVCSSYS